MAADPCEFFIPIARSELVSLLCDDRSLPEADRTTLGSLCDLIAAVCHDDYRRRFQDLKSAYATFDPDTDNTALLRLSADERQHRLNRLYKDLGWLLEKAQFRHLGRDDIEPTLDKASAWGVRMDVDFSAFEHIALFARGDSVQVRTRQRLRNFYRREEVEVPVYRRLVLMLKLRPHPRLPDPVDVDNVLLKIFKDIPKLDVMMLLPGARVRLNLLDRTQIGLPLVSGLAMAVWNFLQDLTQFLETLFLSPTAVWGLAAGGVGYGYKSFYGYLQTKQRYHLTLTRSLYFQNLDSNAGVLTRLLDEAEEQECLSILLGYYCLWRFAEGDGWAAADLDAAIELYLDRYADLSVNCPCGVALAKLRKLGLVEDVAADKVRAVPLPQALAALRGRVESACLPTHA
jgi:hypothetical protein